jgi:hypothetical protein
MAQCSPPGRTGRKGQGGLRALGFAEVEHFAVDPRPYESIPESIFHDPARIDVPHAGRASRQESIRPGPRRGPQVPKGKSTAFEEETANPRSEGAPPWQPILERGEFEMRVGIDEARREHDVSEVPRAHGLHSRAARHGARSGEHARDPTAFDEDATALVGLLGVDQDPTRGQEGTCHGHPGANSRPARPRDLAHPAERVLGRPNSPLAARINPAARG